MNKFFLYIKQVALLATGNKLRFILIFIGTLVGVYIYATGNLILDSIYYGQTKEFRDMPDNSFFVLTEENTKELSEKIMTVNDEIPMLERISSSGHVIYEDEFDDTYLIVYARVHGISRLQNNILLYNQNYGINMSAVNIVRGRGITVTEIMNNELVCMIDEYTEDLLFGNESAVGKYVYFNRYNGGVQAVVEGGEFTDSSQIDEIAFEVVGVMEDSFYTRKDKESVDKYSAGKSQKYVFVNIVCPYDYYKIVGESNENYINIGYMWEFGSKNEMQSNKEKVEASMEVIRKYYNLSDIVDKEYKYTMAEYELNKYQVAINVATVLLFIIMGVSCMSIIFFAMKERVSEIGIKKAFGATVTDIVFQFWLENLLIILASVVVAVLLGFTTVMMCEDFIKNNLFTDFEMHITGKNIFMPIILGMLQGMIFTLIPCIRYSVINVTKALKLEK